MINRVKEFRQLRGLSQAELAKRIGTTNVQISKIENGKSFNFDQAMKIAVALQVQPADLMPIITDGSVPIPKGNDMTSYQKSVMVAALQKFMALHTDYDDNACERLGMAAVKMYQMALDGVDGPFFDFQSIKDSLAPDQNKS